MTTAFAAAIAVLVWLIPAQLGNQAGLMGAGYLAGRCAGLE